MTDDIDMGGVRTWVDDAVDYVAYRLRKDPTHPLQATVEMVSPSMETLHGAADRYDLSTWFASVHPDDLPRVLAAHLHAERTDTVFDQQYRVRLGDEIRWIHTISRPSFDTGGNVTHYNGLMLDVTPRVQAEMAEAEAREALARTQRAAAAGWLAMGVVHDLNNVLQVVQMACTLAAQESDGKVAVLMEEVINAVSRGADVGRRIAGHFRTAIDPAEVDLAQGLRELCRLFNLSRPEVEVTFEGPEQLPFTTIECTVEHGVLNLLANAADATGAGGKIGLSLASAPDGNALIRVTDNGPGVPEEVRDRVFEESFSTKGSTGLGLASSRVELAAIGATLTLEPSSEGACFQISLAPSQEASEQDLESGDATPCHVAIRAEEPQRTLLVKMVEILGHTVTSAQNAEVHVLDGPTSGEQPFPTVHLDGYVGARPSIPNVVESIAKPFRIDVLAAAIERARRLADAAPPADQQQTG